MPKHRFDSKTSNGLFILSDVNLCWYSLRSYISMQAYIFIWNYDIAQEMVFYIIFIKREKKRPIPNYQSLKWISTVYKALYISKQRQNLH